MVKGIQQILSNDVNRAERIGHHLLPLKTRAARPISRHPAGRRQGFDVRTLTNLFGQEDGSEKRDLDRLMELLIRLYEDWAVLIRVTPAFTFPFSGADQTAPRPEDPTPNRPGAERRSGPFFARPHEGQAPEVLPAAARPTEELPAPDGPHALHTLVITGRRLRRNGTVIFPQHSDTVNPSLPRAVALYFCAGAVR